MCSGPGGPDGLEGGAARRPPRWRSTPGPRTGRAWLHSPGNSSLGYLPHAAGAHDTGFNGIVIERFLELLAGPVQARHDRPDRHTQRVRCILIREAFNVDQNHHLAVERRQLLDGGDHLCGGHLVEHIRLGPGALVPELFVKDEVPGVVQADVVLARALEAVPEQVPHDREEPGLHVRTWLVAVLVAKSA